MAHTITGQHIGAHRADDDNYEEQHDLRSHAVVDHDLQHARFGGFHFGAALYGWLVSTGLSVILIALLSAAGASIAVSAVNTVTSGTAATVGIVSGILLLIALTLSYYAGGYVAGRLSRFDGARQGFGSWLIGIIITLILGGLGAAAGARFNVLQQLNLPHLPINQGSFTTGGLITTFAALVLTLLAAILGGKRGEGYHRRIDETGEVGTVDA